MVRHSVLAALVFAVGCGDDARPEDAATSGVTATQAATSGETQGEGTSGGQSESVGTGSPTTGADASATVGATTTEPTGGSGTAGSSGETTSGEVPLVIELPLTDEAATLAVVESYGGYVQGGAFGPDGWTTLTRDDIIVIPLPPSTDASAGALSFTVANFEWDLSTMFWEAWVLVSLDSEGPPFSPTDAGTRSGLQALYQGFNPDDANNGYRPVGYFNLWDPACPGWEECTGEARTPAFWLSADGTAYTLGHTWSGAVDELSFAGNGVVNRTVDLRKTSPEGIIGGGPLFLTINACGGSNANTCGPWDGPPELKGGPIGVTYANLTLDLSR